MELLLDFKDRYAHSPTYADLWFWGSRHPTLTPGLWHKPGLSSTPDPGAGERHPRDFKGGLAWWGGAAGDQLGNPMNKPNQMEQEASQTFTRDLPVPRKETVPAMPPNLAWPCVLKMAGHLCPWWASELPEWDSTARFPDLKSEVHLLSLPI